MTAQDKQAEPGTSPAIQHQERSAALSFVENRATAETTQTLRDEMLYHRATQTYLWAMPNRRSRRPGNLAISRS